MKRLVLDRGGNITVLAALLGSLAIASGTLAVDFGRIALLRSQMQDRADAGALAGAVHLDGRPGARERARRIATEAMTQNSRMSSDAGNLVVESVAFYSAIEPTLVPAETDEGAVFIEVTLAPRNITVLFQPLLNSISSRSSPETRQVEATSIAQPTPFICNAPPMMMCDLAEQDPALDPTLPANAGRQIRLKEPVSGNGSMAPGNFGLLALPDGSSGAKDIEQALAAVEPPDCYSLDLTTAPGSKTQKVISGINARFDLPGGWPHPAPNVINYPRDETLLANPQAKIGNGSWDIEGYWAAKHGGSLPAELAGASRYQVYLYELGLSYARQGRRTIHPVEGTPPDGFELVTPPGPNIPQAANGALANDPAHDGVPSRPIASNGHERRLLTVPLLQCVAEGVRGRGTWPSHGKYVEVFVTEAANPPPDGSINAEIVRAITPSNKANFHANVRLAR